MTNNTTGTCNFSTAFTQVNIPPDYCAIGVVSVGGVVVVVAACLLLFGLICCCRRRTRNTKRAHDKETNERIRGADDGNEAGTSKSVSLEASKRQSSYKSAATGGDGKKANSGKGQKHTSTSGGAEKDLPPFSIDRTSSEGASGKVKVSLTYKKAQDTENQRAAKETPDLIRSVSVSAAVNTKKLPAVPPPGKAGGKGHQYDMVKGTEKEKPHKYDNVQLNEDDSNIMEPKYDTVDTDGTKNATATGGQKNGKGKSGGGDHYYHTLEDSQIEAAGTDEKGYSSTTRMALKVDEKGNAQVMSTEEPGGSKEKAKARRAKSCSGKNPSKGNKAKDHEYDQPSHNTLPHGAPGKGKDKASMQAGKLASMFDDPAYVTSVEVSQTNAGGAEKKTEGGSPKRRSADELVLRNKHDQEKKSAEKGKDHHEYEEPNEKKGKLGKNDLYSSRLFDDPKYEFGNQP